MKLTKPIPVGNLVHALNIHAEFYMDFLRFKSKLAEETLDTSASILCAVLGVNGQQLHTAVLAVTTDEDIPVKERGEIILNLLGLAK